jgi:PBP1b-binding outer membrane lipoprotein LpoB
MKKLNSAMLILALAGAGFVTVGCGTGARVIEHDRSITTVDQIDIQDFRAAASELTREMLNSPRFTARAQQLRSPERLPVMKISRVKNDTTLKLDMRRFLVDPMEMELLRANLVDFFAEDQEAQQLAKMNETLSGQQARLPDLVLYGTVSDLRSQAGRMRQASYIFHLKLADNTGVTIWQGEKLITKQGTRPAVGM